MNDELIDAIAGALTAHGFLLENLYALVLKQDADPIGACQRTARESMRQFEDLPARSEKPVEADEAWRVTQQGLHRLERFWGSVEARLQSAQASR